MNKKLIILLLIYSYITCNMEILKALSDNSDNIKTLEPDVRRKYQDSIDLVNKAAKHLPKVGLDQACYDFIYKSDWRIGELYIFIINQEGTILCEAENLGLIWNNINNYKNFIGDKLLKTIHAITQSGQWVDYFWNKGYRTAYIKKVIYDGYTYYIGTGFFPQTKDYVAEQLVKTAMLYFDQTPSDIAFKRMSNPVGIFVFGDIATYAGNLKGEIVADGKNIANIGEDFSKLQDANGTLVIQNAINKLNESKQPFWLNFNFPGGIQRNYFHKVTHTPSQKEYFFAAKYYLENNLSALDSIKRTITHINELGPKKAYEDISNPLSDFNKSNQLIAIYDLNGVCLANNEYPSLVGRNLLNRKDDSGKLIIKDIVSIANKSNKGKALSFDKNSNKEIFIETIDTADGKAIVCASIYTQSKKYSVEVIVDNGITYLENNALAKAIKEFSNNNGPFFLGDINLFLYTVDGIIVVDGINKNKVWQEYKKVYSSDRVFSELIALANSKDGWTTRNINGSLKAIYVRPVTIKVGNESIPCIIGSGYYL